MASTVSLISAHSSLLDMNAAIVGQAGRETEWADDATAWLAGTGTDRRRVDLVREGRRLIFSKFFCPGLRPRCLAPLESPAVGGEEDALVTPSMTRRCAGVGLAATWEARAETTRWDILVPLLYISGGCI